GRTRGGPRRRRAGPRGPRTGSRTRPARCGSAASPAARSDGPRRAAPGRPPGARRGVRRGCPRPPARAGARPCVPRCPFLDPASRRRHGRPLWRTRAPAGDAAIGASRGPDRDRRAPAARIVAHDDQRGAGVVTGTGGQVPARPSGRGDGARAAGQPYSERAVLDPTDELRILLVEDDDGDAILVEELLSDGDLTVDLHRATTLDAALETLVSRQVHCVLLDLGLPDSVGLSGVERLRAGAHPPALVVLTGHSGIDLGVQAVAAGADDYLVKGEVDGDLLGRSVRYAVQRRMSVEQQRALYRSEVRAAETARLERALLPTPLVQDDRLDVMVGYVPGGNGLLGGDFFDAVERPDGTVLCVIGDVAGHGPDEAALGATLRTAWRTIVLSDTQPEGILPLLERVLVPERSRPEVFVTLCQVVISADRRTAEVYLAGHLAPLLLRDVASEITPTARGRALGIPVSGGWTSQTVELGERWALMLYT